jgi:hypothetical protein
MDDILAARQSRKRGMVIIPAMTATGALRATVPATRQQRWAYPIQKTRQERVLEISTCPLRAKPQIQSFQIAHTTPGSSLLTDGTTTRLQRYHVASIGTSDMIQVVCETDTFLPDTV